jgi:hypothetical protein
LKFLKARKNVNPGQIYAPQSYGTFIWVVSDYFVSGMLMSATLGKREIVGNY